MKRILVFLMLFIMILPFMTSCAIDEVDESSRADEVNESSQIDKVDKNSRTDECLLIDESSRAEEVFEGKLLKEGNVKNVHVTSLPEGYDYSFSGDDAKCIEDYFRKLNLIANFEENPNGYVGMTWVISLEYENGDTQTIYHFGNMFISADKSPWYKMTYEEASAFDTLLWSLKKVDSDNENS